MQTLNSAAYNRRRFLQTSAAVAASAWVYPVGTTVAAPNERANLAAVGVGGKGWSDINAASKGHNVVAFCDVDTALEKRRGGYGAAAEKWPHARRYSDWREMLDKEHQHLDGITVSTPDHMHAPVTMTAMQLGLAVYTQKPMTRTVFEARQLTLAAQRLKVVTQMGNQHHSGSGYRTLVRLIQDGAIGKIREAHAWSNRPIWPQGMERPAGSKPVPKGLAWDLWLGVAPERPFVPEAYHPFRWRGWYDFGAGALGDMGCHIIDPVVWALELGPAQSVWYEGPPPSQETFPEWELIHYDFAGTKYTADDRLHVIWYDGGKLPPVEKAQMAAGQQLPSNGTLFVGEKGTIVTPHGGKPSLFPREKFADFEIPKIDAVDHYQQWTNAILGEGETTSNFGYAGPLTETVLLGTIACRFPETKLAWDSKSLRFTNHEPANEFLHQPYRKGWEVEGLTL